MFRTVMCGYSGVALEHHRDVGGLDSSSLTTAAVDHDLAAGDVSSPASMRSSVLLPQPDGPTSTTNSHRDLEADAWMTSTLPKDLRMSRNERQPCQLFTAPPSGRHHVAL